MEDWINCNEGIPTASELTDAQIIQLVQDEERDDRNDEDQHGILIQKPTVGEVRKALQCLQDFSLWRQVCWIVLLL